jgi:hypothetical protein
MKSERRLLVVGVCLASLVRAGAATADATPAAIAIMGTASASETDRAMSGLDDLESIESDAGRDAQGPDPMPIFVPRTTRGAPAARVGGASRSKGGEIVVRALVPRTDDAALTLAVAPTLYWHLSGDTTHAVNFTLTDPDEIDPIVDVTLTGPFAKGIHAIEMQSHGVALDVGRHYEWFVAVVPDPEKRSTDIIARGAILRLAEPDLESKLDTTDPEQAAALMAQAGIWYETLDVLCRRIDAGSGSAARQRSALLEQVGLAVVDTAE